MRRLLPRELRALARGANVLAFGALALAASTATWSPGARTERLPLPVATLAEVKPRPRPGPDLAEILRLVHHVHPLGPQTQLTEALAPQAPVRPPLSAFEVALLVGVDGAAPRVVITCRDAAHPESYCFARGEHDREARLDAVRRCRECIEFDVFRGSESHTFVVPHHREPVAMLARIVGSREADAGDAAPAPLLASAGDVVSRDAPSVKGVPYFRDGRVIGMRVTGIRPGSWARDLGLAEGDIIESVNDTTIAQAADVTTWQRKTLQPARISVLRLDGASEQRLLLAAASKD